MPATANNIIVRPAVATDASAIADIYAHYVKNTIYTFEEDPPPSAHFMDNIEQSGASNPWLTATCDGEVCGYAYADLWRTRCAYRNTLESSLYVDCQRVGGGIGKALLSELLLCLKKTSTRTVVAVISLPNPGSVGLHEKFGFNRCGIFPGVGRKFGKDCDVGFWLIRLKNQEK